MTTTTAHLSARAPSLAALPGFLNCNLVVFHPEPDYVPAGRAVHRMQAQHGAFGRNGRGI